MDDDIFELKYRFKEEYDALFEECFLHSVRDGEFLKKNSELHLRLLKELADIILDPNLPVALFVTGSLKRKELTPCSDLDMVILTGENLPEQDLNKFLYALWDMGLKVGYSVRTISQALACAREDFSVLTSLLDRDLLWGSRELADRFQGEFSALLSPDRVRTFVREKRDELLTIHNSFLPGGGIPVTPDLKRVPGGLREILLYRWLNRMGGEPDELLRREEQEYIDETYNYLLRVRTLLHKITGLKKDQVSEDIQEPLAELLKVSPRAAFTPGEVMVKEILSRLRKTALYIRAWFELKSLDSIDEATDRFSVYNQFIVVGERIYFRDRSLVEETISANESDEGWTWSRVGEFILHVQVYDAVPGESVILWIYRASCSVREGQICPKMLFDWLKTVCGLRGALYRGIVFLFESGLLGLMDSSFSEWESLYKRDAYHDATVDRHTLRMFNKLESFRDSEKREFRLLNEVYHQIDRPEILHLAMLYHDIGKIRGRGHIAAGTKMVREFLEKVTDDTEIIEQVTGLVEQHILMNHIALRRDIDDEEVVEHFQEHIPDRRFLDELFLLTNLDLMSVAEGVWNEWKYSLFYALYRRTRMRWEGRAWISGGTVRDVIEKVSGSLGVPGESVQDHIENMGDNYLFKYRIADIVTHLQLASRFPEAETEFVYCHSHSKPGRPGRLVVCLPDRPRAFAMISGVLSSLNINIISADIMTRSDGMVFDVFEVTNTVGEPVSDPRKWQRFEERLTDVFADSSRLDEIVPELQKPSRPIVRVRADTSISGKYTVIEVETQDRLGLLYHIGRLLSESGYAIRFAKITTEKLLVVDVFNVVDEDTGLKVQDSIRLDRTARLIRKVLS